MGEQSGDRTHREWIEVEYLADRARLLLVTAGAMVEPSRVRLEQFCEGTKGSHENMG